jgi:predicted peptidase
MMTGESWIWLISPVVALAAFSFPLAAQQETGFLNRSVNIGSKPVRYQVYVPFDYTPAKNWPVILFLHGAGERGTDGLRQTQVGLGTAIRENARWFPAIVVLPQAHPARSGVAALSDRNLSMGGYGAWTLALYHPTMFAVAQRLAGTPAWLFHGAADSVVPATELRRTQAAFKKAGSPVNYTEYPGVGHNSWDPAFSD